MEQKQIFYDLDKMQEISAKLDKISADNSISENIKTQLVNNLMESLDDEVKREFSHFMRTVYDEKDPLSTRTACVKGMENKVALVEFTNIQYWYCRTIAFFGMIAYMQARCDNYKDEESKPHVQKFMKEVFGGDSDKYLGTMYDLFYKKNRDKHANFIPEVDLSLVPHSPSIDQWMNFLNYSDAKYTELRILASGLIGVRPSQDAIIHVHGVFDALDDPEISKYRNANVDKISTTAELIAIPIGKTWLLDKYKQFTSGTVLYNPSEPELEILHSNRQTIDMNSNAMMKKKVKNLKGRMNKQDITQIANYRKEIEKIRNTPVEKNDKVSELRSKIDRIHEKYTGENEVIANVIKIGAKGTQVKTCAVDTD